MTLIKVDKVRGPAYWAPAIINGDTSGMTDSEAATCLAWVNDLALEGWRVVDCEDDAGFASIRINGKPFNGDVITYVILRSK